MSFFNKVKETFKKSPVKDTVMYCSHCGSSDIEYERGSIICRSCNIGDDRIDIIEHCYMCGTEIKLTTKYYKANDTRNIRCKECNDSLIEMKEIEEQEDNFFDLYKNCKVCGKQYKVNNKCNDGTCYSCQLETIKNESKDSENVLKKEVKCCKNCGVEFYAKNSEEICDICKRF